MSSPGNGAMTLSIEDYYERAKGDFLFFLSRMRLRHLHCGGGKGVFQFFLRRPVLMSPDPSLG